MHQVYILMLCSVEQSKFLWWSLPGGVSCRWPSGIMLTYFILSLPPNTHFRPSFLSRSLSEIFYSLLVTRGHVLEVISFILLKSCKSLGLCFWKSSSDIFNTFTNWRASLMERRWPLISLSASAYDSSYVFGSNFILFVFADQKQWFRMTLRRGRKKWKSTKLECLSTLLNAPLDYETGTRKEAKNLTHIELSTSACQMSTSGIWAIYNNFMGFS